VSQLIRAPIYSALMDTGNKLSDSLKSHIRDTVGKRIVDAGGEVYL